MNTYFKKRIVALFVTLLLMTSMFMVPTRTHAAMGVLDTSFDLAALGQGIATLAASAAKWAEENWQKIMRDVIAKRIIDYTVDETVKWVQGGGDPKFISDWDGFMREAGDIAFDSVIKKYELSDICEPFALQLRVALIPETRFNRERVDCTISDIVANVQDFYDNFQNGGWLAYGESIKPENNLYMQLVMLDDEIAARTTFNEDIKRQQSAAGQGFLSVSVCAEDNMQEEYDACISGGGGTDDECSAYAGEASVCTKEEVQTPGTIVGKALGESITSDTQWAANIESWTSALVNAAINRLTREGVAAMTGSSSGAKADYDPAATEYGDLRDEELERDKRSFITQIEMITDPYGQVLADKQTAKTYTEQILDLFSQMVLMDRDRLCIPQVTTSEVDAQRTILSTLTARVNRLQPVVTEGNAIIEQIKAMTGSIRDMSLITSRVSTYMSKESANNQAAMREETQRLTDRNTQYMTLQDVQGRYTQCQNKIAFAAAGY